MKVLVKYEMTLDSWSLVFILEAKVEDCGKGKGCINSFGVRSILNKVISLIACSFLRPTSGVWLFRHIHEYFSPQNISTRKHLLMTNCRRTFTARYNWCQDPVPDRGQAVEKHCIRPRGHWDRLYLTGKYGKNTPKILNAPQHYDKCTFPTRIL